MQDKEKVPGCRLGRRTFLKATGVLGAAAAGAGLKPGLPNVGVADTKATGGGEIRRSICDMCCLGRCGIEVIVKDGRATRVRPFKDYYKMLSSARSWVLSLHMNPPAQMPHKLPIRGIHV